MGTSYGVSGRSQGLTSAQTRMRNAYLNAPNSRAAGAIAGRFRRSTGRSIRDYASR